MKRFMFFLSFLCIPFPFINAGLSFDSIVKTIEGSKKIEDLQVGDEVLCFDRYFDARSKEVESVRHIVSDVVIEIVTTDNIVIRVSPDQKFFVSHKWVSAEDLSLNDVLLKQDRSFIRIKSICRLREDVTFCFIEVKDHHNFLVTENGVLVHNGPAGATVGFWIGRSIAWTGGAIVAAIAAAPAALGGPVAYGVAFTATAGTLAPAIESVAQVAALSGAIIGGTITGPA